MGTQQRLTENHPLTIKVRQVENLMRELGISVHYGGNHFFVSDENSDINCVILDTENGDTTTFPHNFDTKLIIHEL